MKLVLATKNKGKLVELKSLLNSFDIEIISLKDFPKMPEVVEDGKTFLENSTKKAVEVANYTGYLALADDSGLEVDFLDQAPGVYSARFAGEDKNDFLNNQKLLQELEGVEKEKRGARFRCVMVLAIPEKVLAKTEGACEGYIGFGLKGEDGFGYDPLFIVKEYEKSFAQLGLDIKNKISHRAKALEKMVEEIKRLLGSGIV